MTLRFFSAPPAPEIRLRASILCVKKEMQYEDCQVAAYKFLKSQGLPGAALARDARPFDNVKSKHMKALSDEYRADYNKQWPGCSTRDQWSAVNWENQIYVNSKDPSVQSSCGAKQVNTLAALLSHEIYHIKAKSNYCANESRCLYDHEMMAHMYERLVKKKETHQRPFIAKREWKELSNNVFNNYIRSNLSGDSHLIEKLHGMLSRSLRRRMDRVGVSKRIRLPDVDLMVAAGKTHFLRNNSGFNNLL